MKALFFYATAGNAKVAAPLMTHAWTTLRPFHRYLGQAIHTAKQRQFRYQLPWEKVKNLRTIRIEPIDSIVRVPRKTPAIMMVNWPVDHLPDFSRQGFVLTRSVPFSVESAIPTSTGLRIRTSIPLLPTDEVHWCGVQSTLQQESESTSPKDVRDNHGRPLKLVREPIHDGEGHWRMVVEGKHEDGDWVIDGEDVEVEDITLVAEMERVYDARNRPFKVVDGIIRAEEPPIGDVLYGDSGVRYRWSEGESSGRTGHWIQLLPPTADDAEEFIDPRAAFCEGDLEAVWTQPRHHKETTFKVKKVDQDRYQLLLDRYPPEGSTLYLPVDQRNLHLQKRALKQLAEAPLPHHQGLLRLCENPEKVQWPGFSPMPISAWRALKEATRSGTDEQRRFVSKALATRDFAILEGPPGSGKTTAICEIVQQLVEQGQRVLLCASTHVAIDNVLERLLESDSPIDAVRIGKFDKVDPKVQATQLDIRVEKLVSEWKRLPAMQGYGDAEWDGMAERTIIMAANLTCGTTMGIVNHPLFRGRDEDMHISERPISTMPHWDVLIVDEASKTLIQEFLVPAIMAKRWIIVGDVRQLPPFTERADIVANLRDLVDEHDKPVFPADHQRACLLLFRLLRQPVRQPGMRWLLVEKPGVLDWIAEELSVDAVPDLQVVRVVHSPAAYGSVDVVTVKQLRDGAIEALKLAAADWVLVEQDLLPDVADRLPSNLLLAENLTGETNGSLPEGHAFLMRQGYGLSQTKLARSYKDKDFRGRDVMTSTDSQTCEADWLRRHDLAQELTWRLTRLHELRLGDNTRDKERLRKDLNRLQPRATSIAEQLEEIQDIGLPSILEVLQEGIGEHRSSRPSALTMGFKTIRPVEFAQRFESLSFQHRMHPEIASFSRDTIYDGRALKDANTIQIRDIPLAWNFGSFRARRVWAHIDGREQGGVNMDEVKFMQQLLSDFIAWVRRKGPPERNLPRVWEVACLCFYTKQERAISEMLRKLTQDDRKTRFQVEGLPIEIVCGTVDRFQGREADLVLLSMRNTQRTGFLDSPNRLNVAVTRARQQLVIVGNHKYFTTCRISELEKLAGQTSLVEPNDLRQWKRGR